MARAPESEGNGRRQVYPKRVVEVPRWLTPRMFADAAEISIDAARSIFEKNKFGKKIGGRWRAEASRVFATYPEVMEMLYLSGIKRQ